MTTLSDTDNTARYQTRGGIWVTRTQRVVCAQAERAALLRALDARRGLLLASSFEYPGRYKRYDYGFVDPALVIEAGSLSRQLSVRALNARGQLLLATCAQALRACDALHDVGVDADEIRAQVKVPEQSFAEEARTRVPSVLSALRAVRAVFESAEDHWLGLYGAFGHDLVFQFESLRPRLPRANDQRDLVLYLPDALLVIDHQRAHASVVEYEFAVGQRCTRGLPRASSSERTVLSADAGPVDDEVLQVGVASSVRATRPADVPAPIARQGDHAPGEFARLVARARQAFACGDLFEVTPSQCFRERCDATPSQVFEALCAANPAPYGFLANLGRGQHLIGASPEMYVRVSGTRVETCPIAGTIARGCDAIADAAQILKLLCSHKDEAELTMCTDVDRNDKARVCEPGSVQVIGRRQIELYSRLIHTVDHVEGRLRSDADAIDAFMTHMWAVTVTGAPKQAALQFIEDHERSARGYYGGAIGALRFDGSLDTGLVLRTILLERGVASVRAGATLHFDSDPEAEEQETELKASALFLALQAAQADARAPRVPRASAPPAVRQGRAAPPVLLIDHRDSFVHTLADYLRQAGCAVSTHRFDRALRHVQQAPLDLVVLSPGPSRPDDFGMRETLDVLAGLRVPVFGVCLGLQGMVEYCGGQLLQLATPMHGKASEIQCFESRLFRALSGRLRVGRYHSLYARADELPSQLEVLALADEDGACMALSHRSLPWTAVQFHPESILSADAGRGLQLINNVVDLACAR